MLACSAHMRPRLSTRGALALIAAATCVLAPVQQATAKPRADSAGKSNKQSTLPRPEGPLLIAISLGSQTLAVYDRNGRVTSSPISSGRSGFRTPKGIFTILQKNRTHFSNLYNSAPMPFMQRLTWSGVALHAGHLPGYPASHGCIRLPYSFARTLFSLTTLGARVVVTDQARSPQPFRHGSLLRPLPPGDPAALPMAAIDPQLGERVASTSTQVSSLLGVSAAAAAPAVDAATIPGQRTRLSVAAEREAELAGLAAALESERARQADTSARLAAANAEARAAQEDLTVARSARDQLLAAAGTWEKRQAAAERELERAVREWERLASRSPDGWLSEKAEAKAGTREDELEARILEASDEAALARQTAAELEPAIAERNDALAAAVASRDAVRTELSQVQQTLAAAETRLKDAKRAHVRRDQPITVVVSRKTGKLHVRQGYDDVLSAPVVIAEPDRPLGTHMYIAMDYTEAGDELSWTALTVDRVASRARAAEVSRKGRRDRRERAPEAALAGSGPAQSPESALSRIEISGEIRERLAELVKPGSALIVTDNGIGNETGKYTDLIVQLH